MPTDQPPEDRPAGNAASDPPPPSGGSSLALAPRKAPAIPVEAGGRVMAIVPHDLDEAWRLAGAFSAADMTPRGMKTQAQCMVVILAGAELGLPPNQAMQSFYLVNNRPTIWGDAVPALLLSNGFKIKEWMENSSPDYPDNMTARCKITRPDGEEFEGEFSVADAKEAKLWGKDGPWQTSRKRMLKMRARSFCARDGAADVLKGFRIAEEEQDIESPSERRAARTQEATPAGLADRLKANASTEGFTDSHAEIDPVDVAKRAAEVSSIAEELHPTHDAEFEEGPPAGMQSDCEICGAPRGTECKPECKSWDEMETVPEHIQAARHTSRVANTATETVPDAEISPDSSGSATDASTASQAETSSPGAPAPPSTDGVEDPSKATLTSDRPGKVSGDLFAEDKPKPKPAAKSPPPPPPTQFNVRAWAENIERNLPDYAGDGTLLADDFRIHADELREADPEYYKTLRLKVGQRVTELSQPKRP